MVQIVIIRHGEKPRDRSSVDLDHKGKMRAEFLPDYLLHSYDDFKPPVFSFNMLMKAGKSQRCFETMKPTIRKGGLRYENVPRFLAHEMAKYFSDHCDRDKTYVVCWQHDGIVDLVNMLGAKDVCSWGFNPEGGHGEGRECYDATWVCDIDAQTLRLRVFRQFDIVDDLPVYVVPRNEVVFEKSYERTHRFEKSAQENGCVVM